MLITIDSSKETLDTIFIWNKWVFHFSSAMPRNKAIVRKLSMICITIEREMESVERERELEEDELLNTFAYQLDIIMTKSVPDRRD